MIGDLLEAGKQLENEAATIDPLGTSDFSKNLFGRCLVQRDLFIR